MPIPDEPFPIDDSDESVDSASSDLLEEEELEFETADVDGVDDELLDGNDVDDPDRSGFGFGDPSD